MVTGLRFVRTVRMGAQSGVISVRDDAAHSSLIAEIPLSLANAVMPISTRLRGLFDLDAEPNRIDEVLLADALLRGSVEQRAGLRVPGAFSGFEVGIHAIIGQQVSVSAARTLAGRLSERFGSALETHPVFGNARFFPEAETLAEASEEQISSLGILPTRARTLIALARSVCAGVIRLDRGAEVEATIAELERLPGIGAWTAQYIAMRALRWPDAFPSSDLAIRRMMDVTTSRKAEARAESWRPWRAYAAMHLFSKYAEGR
jgi:AraC family transcriptional regulator of adaptative response / DNA-3-methyladenine glycosylase II